jgi:hypothetical protein
MTLCVGILSCPQHQKRLAKFLELYSTKFTKHNIKYYVILSNPKLEKEYEIKGNFFYVKTEEAYEVLAHKLAIFYSYIYEKTNYDYVIKTDDGCLLDFDKILKMPKVDYFGAIIKPTSNKCHFRKCKNAKYNKLPLDFRHNFHNLKGIDEEKIKNITKIKYTAGGYAYGLSRKALSFIPYYKNHILSVGLSYEDVIFGQVMYLNDIVPTNYRFGNYHKIKV